MLLICMLICNYFIVFPKVFLKIVNLITNITSTQAAFWSLILCSLRTITSGNWREPRHRQMRITGTPFKMQIHSRPLFYEQNYVSRLPQSLCRVSQHSWRLWDYSLQRPYTQIEQKWSLMVKWWWSLLIIKA